MRSIMNSAIAALTAAMVTSCGAPGDMCLPSGEKATVLRKGQAEGYSYVVLRRDNGEEVSCTGRDTVTLAQPGDVMDGWTLRRADATKPRP